jgi:hypothetical protein
MKLVRDAQELQLGTLIREQNRFFKNDFTIFKIVQIDHENNKMTLQALIRTKGSMLVKTVSADIDAHCRHYRTTWITYLLDENDPAVILYGKDKLDNKASS